MRTKPAFGTPVFTLAPSREETAARAAYLQVFPPAQIALARATLGAIARRMSSGNWTGTKPVPEPHQWPHTLGQTSGGFARGVLRYYVEGLLDSADSTLVVAGESEHEPTAFVVMQLDVTGEIGEDLIGVAEPWWPICAWISVVSACDDSPKSHPQLAVRAALAYARGQGRHFAFLSSFRTSVLWYVNSHFGRGVNAFVLSDSRCFERTRAYALSATSARDAEDIATALLDCTRQMFLIGLALRGNSALSALDFGRLTHEPPSSFPMLIGMHVRMWPVSRERPLVLGRSYDAAHAVSSIAPGPRVVAGYCEAADGSMLWGARHFLGEFVGMRARTSAAVDATACTHRHVAVFENGKTRRVVGIRCSHGIVFRRSFEPHPLFDARPERLEVVQLASLDLAACDQEVEPRARQKKPSRRFPNTSIAAEMQSMLRRNV
jgi:hypothetical protein